MITGDRSPLWYKDAVVYGVDVGTYMDSDGDGVGDFNGLRSRLDYISSLGVTCIWLLPFYPTPNRDNGYDITDYYSVDSKLGSLGDFVAFMHEASSRGLHILIDLVVHHTSDQHPWFQAARSDRNSPFRDYYVWADEPPDHSRALQIFPDVEDSAWEYDDKAGQWYLHQFYTFQPDLNVEHTAVQEEIRKITGLWIELGAAGFRVDAASHMIGTEALDPEAHSQPHDILRHMRDMVSAEKGNAVLVAEADVEASELIRYFGDGHEMQMLYNFVLDNYIFLALARKEAKPIAKGLSELSGKPATGQWLNFLRNLDELDLERLSDEERDDVYRSFAPDKDMRIYERGIRRRLAPMLNGDRGRIELAFSLLFSLPGTPMLVYGDELGMGEDLSLPERQSVRTVMQWSSERNGGFSTAAADDLTAPAIDDGDFSYTSVNVVDQRRNSDSLLSWMQRIIHLRRQCPEIGRGECTVIKSSNPAVLVHRCDWEGGTFVAVHNLSDETVTTTLDAKDALPHPVFEIFGNHEYPEEKDLLQKDVTLDSYGYRWFRCGSIHL